MDTLVKKKPFLSLPVEPYKTYKVLLGVHAEDNKNKIPNQFCVIEKARSLFA